MISGFLGSQPTGAMITLPLTDDKGAAPRDMASARPPQWLRSRYAPSRAVAPAHSPPLQCFMGGGGVIYAAAALPSDYDGLEGCAALSGLSRRDSPLGLYGG
jgi:hypothetical protein